MRQSQQTDDIGRRAVLGLTGGTALGLLAGTTTASGGAAGANEVPGVQQAQEGLPGYENLKLEQTGRYESGLFDEGGAEIIAYHAPTQRLFVINANLGGVDVLDVTGVNDFDGSNPADLTRVGQIDAVGTNSSVSSANSVATPDHLVAVALEANTAQDPGQVGFYDPETLEPLGTAPVGPLPDKVTFTPDGTKVLVANSFCDDLGNRLFWDSVVRSVRAMSSADNQTTDSGIQQIPCHIQLTIASLIHTVGLSL